jgi:riboflavin kinase / FMN adenylyltransferase
MAIIEKLEDFSYPTQNLVLTIGNFDGMHRGHCAVLKRALAVAGQAGKVVVLTFRNHPSEVLRPDQPIRLLNTIPHKILLLQRFGIEHIVLLPFTRHLAQRSAESFIEHVRQFIPFTHLILGHDATLGRDRQGDRATMQTLGMEWGFQVHYLEEYRYEGKPVSSTRIREALQQGDFTQVEELLNRPYSIYASVTPGAGKGKQLGFPTVNLDVSGLCLPPFGVYSVDVIHQSKHLQGIANLGIAPTLRKDEKPILEVHLFEGQHDWEGHYLEVIFKGFVRPEHKFNNVQELQQQIRRDIEWVKAHALHTNSKSYKGSSKMALFWKNANLLVILKQQPFL